MNREGLEHDAADIVLPSSNEIPKQWIIVLSNPDLESLNRIKSRFMLYDLYICEFRNAVLKYAPNLKKSLISVEALSKFCARMKQTTRIFSSAINQLQQQLEFCGFKFQNMQEIFKQIVINDMNHDKLTLFLQTVGRFCAHDFDGLNISGSKEAWDNVKEEKYSLDQMCEIIYGSRIEYGLIRKKISMLIPFSMRLFASVALEKRFTLVLILNALRDICCEVKILDRYLIAISNVASQFKETQQKKLKDKKMNWEKEQKRDGKSASMGENEEINQGKRVQNEKVKVQQSGTKSLYLTFKQKAHGLLQTFFGGRSTLFKGQKQQPQQQQRLLEEK